MNLIIDDSELVVNDLTALQVAVNHLQTSKKYIRSVAVNGQNVLLKDVYSGKYPMESRVEIHTYASFDDLIEDTMISSGKLMPNLISALNRVVSALDEYKETEAIEWFEKAVPALDWHIGVLTNLASMAPDKEAIVYEMYERTQSAYETVKQTVVNQDSIAFRDVLLHELQPLLVSWDQSCQVFHQQMKLEHAKAKIHAN